MTQDAQNRIDELEVKSAFQEQLISDLNDELVKHGSRIAELEQKMERLIEHLKSHETKDSPTDERPPHY